MASSMLLSFSNICACSSGIVLFLRNRADYPHPPDDSAGSFFKRIELHSIYYVNYFFAQSFRYQSAVDVSPCYLICAVSVMPAEWRQNCDSVALLPVTEPEERPGS